MLYESHGPPYLFESKKTELHAQNLSPEQTNAVDQIHRFLNSGHSVIALSGPAGSGKTCLIKELKKTLEGEVVVSAMTNKAVDVLRRKEVPDALTAYNASLVGVYKDPGEALKAYFKLDDPFGSIKEEELLFYFDVSALRRAWNANKTDGIKGGAKELGIDDFYDEFFIGWEPRIPQDATLIIDEASMLGGELLAKIRKCFSKIILVGDEYQLPPVNDAAVFWNESIVQSRVTLTEVHRQSGSSEVLDIANRIKSKEPVELGNGVPIDLNLIASGIPVIVWTNERRVSLTKRIRSALGHQSGNPTKGELLVCRDNRTIGGLDFVKNSMWRVVETDGIRGCILEDCFGQRSSKPVQVALEEYNQRGGLDCRFGYALTCHTAQGSEWPTVLIHVDDTRECLSRNQDCLKWLYTAVTRAKEKLIWVSDQIAEHGGTALACAENE
ncbi:MAG: AAA family ATPase [Candidatus Melainabacteria bacterium]|nr:AAA family ATPase [Candidatus Melainabacteria bacterium]